MTRTLLAASLWAVICTDLANIKHLCGFVARLKRPGWKWSVGFSGLTIQPMMLEILVLSHRGVSKSIKVRIVQSGPGDGVLYRVGISFYVTPKEVAEFFSDAGSLVQQPEYVFMRKGD